MLFCFNAKYLNGASTQYITQQNVASLSFMWCLVGVFFRWEEDLFLIHGRNISNDLSCQQLEMQQPTYETLKQAFNTAPSQWMGGPVWLDPDSLIEVNLVEANLTNALSLLQSSSIKGVSSAVVKLVLMRWQNNWQTRLVPVDTFPTIDGITWLMLLMVTLQDNI